MGTAARPDRGPGAGKINGQPKVLVVDDQLEIRELIQSLLELHGYQTYSAVDGVEAVELARTLRPHLITLDLAMPRRDGHAVLADLAADPALARIPVVVVSAYAVDLARTPQVVEVLHKPFDAFELVSAVEVALARV